MRTAPLGRKTGGRLSLGEVVARWAANHRSICSLSGYPLPSRLALGERRVASGSVEYPFGQLAVAGNGALYYVDREYGRISEITRGRTQIVLSSLDGASAPTEPIVGLSGLSVSGATIWFTAGNTLYQASLNGHKLRRAGNAPGAVDIDALRDGTAYFTTATAVFERAPDGRTIRVAGGTIIGFAKQQSGPQPATGEAINPDSVVGAGPHVFYFTNENSLYLVKDGIATVLRPRSDFFNGELATGPTGAIYGICNWRMCRVAGSTFTPLFKLPEPVNGAFAAPDALAVSPSGSFYLSYSDQSSLGEAGIVEISSTGKILDVVASRKSLP